MSSEKVYRYGEFEKIDPFIRYMRVNLSPPFAPLESSGLSEVALSELRLPNLRTIDNGVNELRIAKADVCLYCGAPTYEPGSSKRLSEEHIVPRGLGGNLIVTNASCKKCSIHTNQWIENRLLKKIFNAPRRQLGVRTRKRKAASDEFDLLTIQNGKEVRIKLPLASHPTTLLLPHLRMPTMLGGLGGLSSVTLRTFSMPDAVIKRGAQQLISHSLDMLLLSQLLAKIAHCYATAIFDQASFDSFLLPTIMAKYTATEVFSEQYKLIGGSATEYTSTDQSVLHQLGHEIVRQDGQDLVCVGIRLFSCIAGAVYWIVAGRIK